MTMQPEISVATLAYGRDAQRQEGIHGVRSARVNRRAGTGVPEHVAGCSDISLKKAVVGRIFAGDVPNKHPVFAFHTYDLSRRLGDESVRSGGGNRDRPQVGADKDGF